MGSRLPSYRIWQICVALYYGWAVEWIVAATQVHRATIYRIRTSLDVWGTPYPPSLAKIGRPRLLTALHEKALLAFLTDRPTAFLDEMAWFLYDEFSIVVGLSTIWKTLSRIRWSRKVVQRKAIERAEDLRSLWKGRQIVWDINKLVFINESGANERTRYRKFGWSPTNLPAIEVSSIRRSERWSILPAYGCNGFLKGTLIYQGSITAEIFNAWIEVTVLPQCAPGTILVMDNASIHRNKELRALCERASVYIEYLPPYSPEFNPIELSFHDLKTWIRRNIHSLGNYIDFGNFLRFGLQNIGNRMAARSHFRHAGFIYF